MASRFIGGGHLSIGCVSVLFCAVRGRNRFSSSSYSIDAEELASNRIRIQNEIQHQVRHVSDRQVHHDELDTIHAGERFQPQLLDEAMEHVENHRRLRQMLVETGRGDAVAETLREPNLIFCKQ